MIFLQWLVSGIVSASFNEFQYCIWCSNCVSCVCVVCACLLVFKCCVNSLLGSRYVHRQLLRRGNELQYRSVFQSSILIGWVRVY